MPDALDSKSLKFSASLMETIKKGHYGHLSSENLKELATKSEAEYIGGGTECAVINHQNEPKKVVAFRYYEIPPQDVKKVYYVQRILSTLFPYNFPYFSSSFTGKKEKSIASGTVRQKVSGNFTRVDDNVRLSIIRNSKLNKYPFGLVEKKLASLGISVYFDSYSGNYDLNIDGGECYLDTPYLGDFEDWDKEKLLRYMKENKRQDGVPYSQGDIETVEKSIDRLVTLGIIKLKSDK